MKIARIDEVDIMRYAYREACSEVCFILDNFESNSRLKIPEKIINLLEENKIKHYPININLSIPLKEQVLKEETKAILALLYRKFLCSESERTILEEEFQNKLKEEKIAELDKREKAESEIKKVEIPIAQKQVQESIIINIESNSKNMEKEISLITEKQTLFGKFWTRIKKFLYIK